MSTINFIAKSFRKMEDPVNSESGHVKYVCYVKADSIPQEMNDWFSTNPREQKMSTNVAKKIQESLETNSNFHELNRGVVISANEVKYDNKSEILSITLSNSEIHGNIDGGHTLRAILEGNKENSINKDRFVFFEIFTGIESPVELAAARNTSVQVDLKSIAELEKSFDVLKEVFNDKLPFSKRIQYKMNEHYNNSNISPIDIREIIAIISMFSQDMYPFKDSKGITDTYPIQCYSGKEATLRKFLNLNSTDKKQQKIKRDTMIENMTPIIKDIFSLWEKIECEFATTASAINKRYGTKKYSKYNKDNIVGKSLFCETDLKYIIPKGIMYPLVGAFRALIVADEDKENQIYKNYSWKEDPITVWKEIGSKLVAIILDEKQDNPEILAKNQNLWSNLFKEVYIYAYM